MTNSPLKRRSYFSSALFSSRENRFFYAAFCIVWSYSILKPLRYSLVASSLGIHHLPSLKVASLILLGIYSFTGDLVKKSHLIMLSALLCFFSPFFNHNFYCDMIACIALDLIPTLTLSILWSMMHTHFDSQEAQSFYPRVCLVGEVGSLCSLFTGAVLSYFIFPSYLLALSAGVLYLFSWFLLRDIPIQNSTLKTTSSIPSLFSLIGIIIGIKFLGTFVKITSEYMFLQGLEQYCHHNSTQFLFVLYSFKTLLHLSCTILLYGASSLQKKYYWWIAPACALTASIALLFAPSFYIVALSFFFIDVTHSSLYYPYLMMLYKNIPTTFQRMLQTSGPICAKIISWILASSVYFSFSGTLLGASATWLILLKVIYSKKQPFTSFKIL